MTKEEFEKRAAAFGRAHGLWQRGDGILAAVSGGPDSLGLLLFFHEAAGKEGLRIGCCCVNHHLREKAGEETEYVRTVCGELGIPFYQQDVQVEAARQHTGESVETAARRLRYEALEKVRQEGNYRFIAAAHHMDDQAETVIFRFLRGSGEKGLSGMRPKRGHLIRPFLGMRRQEIAEYLQHFPYEPCHDETNDIPDATRNRIRLELLPILCRYNPMIVPALARTADLLREDDDYLRALAAEQEKQVLLYEGKSAVFLDRNLLRTMPLPPERRLLRLFLSRYADKEIEYDGLIRLESWIREKKNGGEMSFSGVYIRREKGWISLQKGSTRKKTVLPAGDLISFLYRTAVGENEAGRIEGTGNADIIKEYRCLAGTWRLCIQRTEKRPDFLRKNQYLMADGDEKVLCLAQAEKNSFFAPRGTDGTKKVGDILREKGIPPEARPFWPVVSDGTRICWVGLLRGSRYSLPGKEDSRFLLLTLTWDEKEI